MLTDRQMNKLPFIFFAQKALYNLIDFRKKPTTFSSEKPI